MGASRARGSVGKGVWRDSKGSGGMLYCFRSPPHLWGQGARGVRGVRGNEGMLY